MCYPREGFSPPPPGSCLALCPVTRSRTRLDSLLNCGNQTLEFADIFIEMEMQQVCCAGDHDGGQATLMLAQCLSSPLCCLPPPLLAKARQASFSLANKAQAPTEANTSPCLHPHSTLSPGKLIVIAIDPCATLAPLMTVDGSLEKRVKSMEAGMRRYLAFVRHVERPPNLKDPTRGNNGKVRRFSLVAAGSRDGPSRKETARRTHLQLCLLHHKPPKKSRYDNIDESMCIPLEWEGQHRRGLHVTSQSSPLRSSFGDDRAPLRIDGATEAVIPTSYRHLYAYTTIEVAVTVASLDDGVERMPGTFLSISEREMQRFDAYQAVDCLREEEGCEDQTTSESGEVDEECELSTVISGLSMSSMRGVPSNVGYHYWDPPLISPTTAASRDTKYELDSSEPSNSTQPTTLPSYFSSREEEEEEADQARNATRIEPLSFGRQCTLHARVWSDIEGVLRNAKPADPRSLLEDLRKLQTLERAVNTRATSQIKEFAAARVAAWTQNPVRDSSDQIPWPTPTSSSDSAFKSIKNVWRRLICRKSNR